MFSKTPQQETPNFNNPTPQEPAYKTLYNGLKTRHHNKSIERMNDTEADKTNKNTQKETNEKRDPKSRNNRKTLESYHRNKEARRARCKEKVICENCYGIVSRENLKRHQKNPKCELMRAIREKNT